MNQTEDYPPFFTGVKSDFPFSDDFKEVRAQSQKYYIHPKSPPPRRSVKIIQKEKKISLKDNNRHYVSSNKQNFSPYSNYSDKRKPLNIDTVTHVNYKFFPSRSNRSQRIYSPQQFQISYYQNHRSSQIVPVVKGFSLLSSN